MLPLPGSLRSWRTAGSSYSGCYGAGVPNEDQLVCKCFIAWMIQTDGLCALDCFGVTVGNGMSNYCNLCFPSDLQAEGCKVCGVIVH